MEEENEGPLTFLAKNSEKPIRFELTFVKEAAGLSPEHQEQTKQRKIICKSLHNIFSLVNHY